ncbi:Modification methylase FokI (plasmid) [Paracoccus marcusii]|uniref:DNA adenine methylase n=1 Tax=Paracoccus marcusii TaxID=59779 RepID=UPI001FD34763|nr:DNA adenine methylase [Paracoccus marcusii]QXI66241.1 Modification methylase FokI [Paracoccus marcusii]
MNQLFTPDPHRQEDLFGGDYIAEDSDYLSEQLITYIGNKRRLIPMIEQSLRLAMREVAGPNPSFADVFAGTGVVSRMARAYAKTLYVNDFEEYSSFSNTVYQTNRCDIPSQEVEIWRKNVNEAGEIGARRGIISEFYAPADECNITAQDRVFYTKRNAAFIDSARAAIDEAPEHIRPYLLAPLIQRASVHVNTSGVFKGFYKNKDGVGQFGGTMRNALQRIRAHIDVPFPVLSRFKRESFVTRKEATDFVSEMPDVDVAYFDPPYNQHPYGSNYFMLNLILRNERPEEISRVSGIPKQWQRSPYNIRAEAGPALASITSSCPAKILLVSYNSEGFISPEEMMSILEPLGEVEVFDQKYSTFRGCRNLSGRSAHVTEMLFKVKRT